ncbi:GH3 auxin-responsive promoter family protein [Thermoflavifilum thermophilum]|uniref:GH3 auxin-responsive promoter n=1 Tax=Thermoflavifilum thermophilum TaxID=1393122 RepID=A0A1I7N1H0_9BACT|nr:GH3 auxin-responsive promoter family protein [Thermoflavifilum thermophilum]SFV28478.1 GH3 auxin-responsive promoter [Thermoflavifilum thermophilum]
MKSVKSLLAVPLAAYVRNRIKKQMLTAAEDQLHLLEQLLRDAQHTLFGKAHHFQEIKDYKSYREAVPIRDYEGFKPYIEKIKSGTQNVLWKGQPLYFAKTSGTTSGVKYIPISKDSIHNHIDTARNALLCYIAETGNHNLTDGKMIFLSGSPVLERVGGIPTGRLSGIVNHHVPRYLRTNQLPSFETNCIEDWETKLDKIVEETIHQPMTLISGIPPWMQMYFDRLQAASGKKIKELFPQLTLIVHGGVNFEPYRARLMESLGEPVDTLETYPASEGFLAFQDQPDAAGLLLNTHSGIFFEFVPADEIFQPQPTRLSLGEVQTGVNYAVLITSNAGLWAYNLGDTVRFVSLNPYRIVVTGRISHFISAFGEHVIAEEVEQSLQAVASSHQVKVTEFTVAPRVQVSEGRPYHEWYIEFEQAPADLERFAEELDQQMRKRNIYYNDLITGHILERLQIRLIRKNGFIDYMRAAGKLGGQNKLPRLSNDRYIADALQAYVIS